ncbi:hypothetical protein DNHGIG_14960 [Collibacillus ludicampi]|uniref:HNH nuclease domain-containing protein n=1 Tax=Collibacillus ludicampi TaxID=2771369 RepID=A0AAV4LDT6_9BACL|nr:HNH endonuclease signature motif containing protein [Collibacillus ludicampi]GIM45947.1 hypothetical protein DNHGIG_14960 [Collibacillus ludicampi]
MSFNHGLKRGEVITNEKLMRIFKCGISGGMRRSNETNTLVLISDHTKSLYDDRWDGEIIHYTGMGKIGDQSLTFMQNKTLYESNENGIEVYFFEVFEPNNYIFWGQVKLHGEPYQEYQLDEEGNKRKVWIFPLEFVNDTSINALPESVIKNGHEQNEKKVRKLDDKELLKRASLPKSKAGIRKIISQTYDRDPFVSEYAKRRARGYCQLCEKPAPFTDKKGQPYLETHHIVWLSKGGPDTIENTVALCPNCHRKMHSLNLDEDIEKLMKKANEYIKVDL